MGRTSRLSPSCFPPSSSFSAELFVLLHIPASAMLLTEVPQKFEGRRLPQGQRLSQSKFTIDFSMSGDAAARSRTRWKLRNHAGGPSSVFLLKRLHTRALLAAPFMCVFCCCSAASSRQ